MRKITILAAVALAVGTAYVGVAAGPAGAVARASTVSAAPSFTGFSAGVFTGFPAGVLCDQESTALCMDSPAINTTVNGAHYHPGDTQNVSVAQATNCGGTVTADCPFTPGLGDNTLFKGKPLITITNLHAGDPYLYNPDNLLYEAEGGNGQVFVQLGDPINGFAYLINVYATDLVGGYQDAVYICTNGNGLALLGRTGSGLTATNCGWTKHST